MYLKSAEKVTFQDFKLALFNVDVRNRSHLISLLLEDNLTIFLHPNKE